ncbi:cell division protein [Candidatus Photodesmus blepharus]|uniref:Cell division protein ZapB n=1 Tax=Candidatus Photodesmus blepharonis TaxID=1179155 RepID=A0A084CP48_9GAMM|nr:cell division protein ZapB [Candidatus Photodesmus blepharus]KEY91577.1 cell division protein [Candidatus Photodesmus blepharus]
MSFEVLEQLEAKIQAAVDTIVLLQMEVEELKADKERLTKETNELKKSREKLESKAQQIQQEHAAWQDRIRNLLDKMNNVE